MRFSSPVSPPPTVRRALGTRAWLLLLVAVLAVPFVAYAGWQLFEGFERDHAHARRITQDTAQLASARLDDHLGNLKITLMTVGHMASAHMDEPLELAGLLGGMQAELAAEGANVSVWRLDGSRVASLDPALQREAVSMAERPHFKEALRTSSLGLEAPVPAPGDGAPTALLGMPVWDGQRVVGVVSVATDLERLPALADVHRDLPAGAVVTVVDLQGVVLARSLDARHWIGRQMLPDPARLQQQRAAGLGVLDNVTSFDGRVRMIAFAAVRQAPWVVYVGVPVDAAMAPAWHRLWRSVFLLVPTLALVLAATVWLARRLTVPLQRLSRASEALGQGGLAHLDVGSGPRELRSLAGALQGMAEDLQRRTAAQRESERLLRDLTDHLPALISFIDRDGILRFANRSYQQWLGLAPEQVIGRSVQALYGEAVHAAVKPHFDAAYGGRRVTYERTMQTLWGPRLVEVTLMPRHEGGSVSGIYTMVLDITEQRSAQARLALSEERLSLAMEGSEQALFDWHLQRDTVYQSAQAAVLRGGSPVEATSSPEQLLQWVHPDDVTGLREAVADTLRGRAPAFRSEHRIRMQDGRWCWILSRGRVVERDAAGRAIRLAGTHVDITARHELEAQLRALADFDPLTGLPNRRRFLDRLDVALARARRLDRALALMFLDIDHFKQVNDTFGHAAGDQVLQAVAERLQRGVRASDTVARLAGDEFTVIMEGFEDTGSVGAVARGLVDAVRHTARFGEAGTWPISISLGVALVDPATLAADPAFSGDRLLQRADQALYRAKQAGRDGHCLLVGGDADAG